MLNTKNHGDDDDIKIFKSYFLTASAFLLPYTDIIARFRTLLLCLVVTALRRLAGDECVFVCFLGRGGLDSCAC